MSEDEFNLGWANYTQRSKIDSNPDITTFIIKYTDTDSMDERLQFLESWFLPPEFVTEESLLQDDLYGTKVFTDSKCVVLFAGLLNDVIAIRCLSSKCLEHIRGFLTIPHDSNEAEYEAEIAHGIKSFKLGKYLGTEYSGIVDTDDQINLRPLKFYELRLGNLLIAKVLLSYYNGEMDDTTPNIEMIEVREVYRGKGIGKKLVKYIEKQAKSEGFNRIRIEDMDTSYRFWEKLGYEMDLDEAVKYL